MKKYFAIISALTFVFTVSLLGCEKKAEAPKAEPVVTPAAPAPAPVAAPVPAPAPAKPAKK
ncbi:MAG: hypothetical protein A2010_05565 [Nitrospirae bacterium GWD2_57_9]|nr:MAG: hypothetical protein A2010_05565 [Nitrospirae bacterium GWD2_57_9]OGW50159.1 MAG: hypothetical protein A2078_06555 [Nitrospirae bacterium GWC2_57_9]